ncbi:MAG TPA: GGDEF domain-containing protein [Symbiobacteriaceae bacterium]
MTTLVVFLVTVGTFAFGKFAFRGLNDTLDKATGLGVLTAAQTLAESVDPGWLTSLNLDAAPDMEFGRLQRQFKKLVAYGYIKRAILVRLNHRESVDHVLNVPVDNSKDYTPSGTKEQLAGSLYLQESPGYHLATLERPGVYVAGWVPIMQKNEQVGLLVLFIDATEIQGTLTAINVAMLAILFLLPFLAGVVTYKFSAGFEKTAVTDGLMGIYNRKYFNQRLEQEVARAQRYGQLTALVMMDIDFFKRVNDTYGHATGDITLKSLAKWVSDSVRTTDVVCRYGGEEIAVILSHTGIAGAQEFAERLRLKISQQYVKDPGEGVEFRVTVSMGVAQWEKGLDPIGLVKRADASLYHSKHNGRNRVTIYTEDIHMEPEKHKPSGDDRQ